MSAQSLITLAPASVGGMEPTLSDGTLLVSRSMLNTSIPSYLRSYICKDSPARAKQPEGSCDGLGTDENATQSEQDCPEPSKGAFNSLTATLFSRSREVRLLLDKLSSFDQVLDKVQHCFGEIEKRFARDDMVKEDRDADTLALRTKAEEILEAIRQYASDKASVKEEQNRIRTEWLRQESDGVVDMVRNMRSTMEIQAKTLSVLVEQNQNMLKHRCQCMEEGEQAQLPRTRRGQSERLQPKSRIRSKASEHIELAKANGQARYQETKTTTEPTQAKLLPAEQKPIRSRTPDVLTNKEAMEGTGYPYRISGTYYEAQGTFTDRKDQVASEVVHQEDTERHSVMTCRNLPKKTQRVAVSRRLLLAPATHDAQELQATPPFIQTENSRASRTVSEYIPYQAIVIPEDDDIVGPRHATSPKRKEQISKKTGSKRRRL
ncbi:hypothetical protein BGZ54_004047 [Gamsiella multidivaricata]|nr:hypothetical protein BGZ54_004047 [Gamsiella multidivaricata]